METTLLFLVLRFDYRMNSFYILHYNVANSNVSNGKPKGNSLVVVLSVHQFDVDSVKKKVS